jgi:hypothetical protein
VSGTAAVEEDTQYGDVWLSSDSGRSWSWQESTASFGARTGAASLVSGDTWLLVGGVSRGVGYADVYAATLPHGNPSNDGGVVGGILGAAMGILVALFLGQKCLDSWRDKQRQKRLRAYHMVGTPEHSMVQQIADPNQVHVQVSDHGAHGGGGAH